MAGKDDNYKMLSSPLREMLNWSWGDFCYQIHNSGGRGYSSRTAIVISLIRYASQGSLSHIRLVLDRIDGRIESQVRVELPRFYTLYPYADKTYDELSEEELKELPEGITSVTAAELSGKTEEEMEAEAEAETGLNGIVTIMSPDPEELEAASLRDTLLKLAEYDSRLPAAILEQAEEIDDLLSRGDNLIATMANPRVKSVLASALLHYAGDKDNAKHMAELFDQLEGKIEKVVRLVGDDVYLTSYDEIAPAGARRNKDGVYEVESSDMNSTWKTSLLGDIGDDDDRYSNL